MAWDIVEKPNLGPEAERGCRIELFLSRSMSRVTLPVHKRSPPASFDDDREQDASWRPTYMNNVMHDGTGTIRPKSMQ